MVPDIGMVELMLVAIVALIVVGPKELPKLTRSIGQVVRKARGLASEFQRAFDEMGREAELEELRKEVRDLKRMNPIEDVRRELSGVEHDTREAMRGDTKA
ncbi:MAG: Sec-independent protein translocase protein TatB [Caulobacterales bacterium]|nr:Sec-independent protein translocase protein TatB [Caulobacterales bacterium]